ncbi:hypothetical protein HDV01_005960 [Terramyces sp. JEL0728]|nr:hypothetical protein HDV01_005960 [Terramyces sp. JEL0728]
MASYQDLKDGSRVLMIAMAVNLKERGVIAKLEAILRAEMFESIKSGYDSVPNASQETRLINELIREYLQFNGYGHTLSVFKAEANLSNLPRDRSLQIDDLGLNDKFYPSGVPLLYGLALTDKLKNPTEPVLMNESKVLGQDINEGFEIRN